MGFKELIWSLDFHPEKLNYLCEGHLWPVCGWGIKSFMAWHFLWAQWSQQRSSVKESPMISVVYINHWTTGKIITIILNCKHIIHFLLALFSSLFCSVARCRFSLFITLVFLPGGSLTGTLSTEMNGKGVVDKADQWLKCMTNRQCLFLLFRAKPTKNAIILPHSLVGVTAPWDGSGCAVNQLVLCQAASTFLTNIPVPVSPSLSQCCPASSSWQRAGKGMVQGVSPWVSPEGCKRSKGYLLGSFIEWAGTMNCVCSFQPLCLS